MCNLGGYLHGGEGDGDVNRTQGYIQSVSECYNVVQCSALLNLEPRGVSDVSFSSCTVPNYLILMSEYFRWVPRTPRILEVSEVVQEFGSKFRTGV